ncbi:MAG: protein kinase, partial [Candidatus Margulisbacteria bacterium]|nr:protein kinase [Candidatus Margulisiibacteriota bacterium]
MRQAIFPGSFSTIDWSFEKTATFFRPIKEWPSSDDAPTIAALDLTKEMLTRVVFPVDTIKTSPPEMTTAAKPSKLSGPAVIERPIIMIEDVQALPQVEGEGVSLSKAEEPAIGVPALIKNSVEATQDLSGTTVAGRYEVLRSLAEGGLGIIYVAKDLQNNGQEVILKTYKNVSEGKSSLEAEIRTMQKLGQGLPNIVNCLAAGENFLILEYVQQNSLFSFIRGRGPLLTEDYMIAAMMIIREALVGLEYLAANDVVSGDVSSANILATSNVQEVLEHGAQVTHIDLGLREWLRVRLDGGEGSLVVGKPSYMSPEQARGIDSIDQLTHQSDLFGLGITFFHMLNGKRPFEGIPMDRRMYPDLSLDCEILIRKGREGDFFGQPLPVITRKRVEDIFGKNNEVAWSHYFRNP